MKVIGVEALVVVVDTAAKGFAGAGQDHDADVFGI